MSEQGCSHWQASCPRYQQANSDVSQKAQNMEELQSCREEEQLRLDGLMSIIVMTVKAAAAEPPHNPFSINGDVNQPEQTEPIRTGPPPREDGDQ